MKKALRLAALFMILALSLTGCGGKEEATTLRFADATSYDTLKSLNGKQVSIVGYMATLSPISGEYIYLMNMPFQSCPFCVPNTTQLANTMAVYAKKGGKFEYTDQAVRITGTMRTGNFTDDYGYVYNYRIENAACETVDLGEISDEYALWQSIASDGIVAEISSALDYVYFTCCWPEYQAHFLEDDGSEGSYYLYPGDAENYLKDDGPYGYAKFAASDYFDGLVKRIKAISATGLDDLIEIVEDARRLEKEARAELSGGNYVYNEAEDKYHLDRAEELSATFDDVYLRFSQWLAKWEL